MDDFVVIALFRHGLTKENQRRAYLGWTDSPLCPFEKKKLKRLSAHYELLFSSDLHRCIETAKILFPNYKPIILREMREMNFGCWEGKTYEELKHDSAYQKWLSAPFREKPSKGELFPEFAARVEKGWEEAVIRILGSGAKKAAIMTHGGVIRYLLSQYAPKEQGFWEWGIPYAKGYELIWNRAALRRRERCILLREVPSMAKQNGSENSIN